MKKNKITLAMLLAKYGGNVTSVNDLVLGLNKERFNVIFIYLSGIGADDDFIKKTGYDVFYLAGAERLKGFRFSILSRLIRILKRSNVDIIHCHGHKATVYGAIASRFVRVPVVIAHVHGLNRSKYLRRKIANFFLFKWIDRIICVANSVREDVLKNNWSLSADKVSVLENSVDYKRFADVSISKADAKRMLDVPSNAFVFGTVGRLVPTKGQLYLIEAFAKVKQKLPKSVLLLVGGGRLENVLKREASKTDFGESIHFLGLRTDVPQGLKALDVFVFPSVNEGFGLALVEAMAAGVPCIATEVGGIPEIINTENVGILVPPTDADALAQAMFKVANMPKDRLDRLIQNAQNRVKQVYSHDVVREKLKNLYEDEFNVCVRNR